jgi:hypothetical protein
MAAYPMSQRNTPKCYVESIQDRQLTVLCDDLRGMDVLRELGGRRSFLGKRWRVRCGDEAEMVMALRSLRDAGFAFVGGVSGWPPAEVFDALREKGELDGRFEEIMWRMPGEPIVRER